MTNKQQEIPVDSRIIECPVCQSAWNITAFTQCDCGAKIVFAEPGEQLSIPKHIFEDSAPWVTNEKFELPDEVFDRIADNAKIDAFGFERLTNEGAMIFIEGYMRGAKAEYLHLHSSQPTGQPRWVKAKERLPADNKSYPVRWVSLNGQTDNLILATRGKIEELLRHDHDLIVEWLEELPASPSTVEPVSRSEAERAFIMGYFNRPDPPASFVDDIADGKLKESWERCKPFISATVEPAVETEEIEKLRGLLLEFGVRAGALFPTEEWLVDLFDIGFAGCMGLFALANNLLYDNLKEIQAQTRPHIPPEYKLDVTKLPPSVQQEVVTNVQAVGPKMRCTKHHTSYERGTVCPECAKSAPSSPTSIPLEEGERKNLPDDLIHWVREAEDRYSHQKSDQDAYRAGAADMYWRHCHGVENPTRLSFVEFAYGCMNKRDELQSELSVLQQKIEDGNDAYALVEQELSSERAEHAERYKLQIELEAQLATEKAEHQDQIDCLGSEILGYKQVVKLMNEEKKEYRKAGKEIDAILNDNDYWADGGFQGTKVIEKVLSRILSSSNPTPPVSDSYHPIPALVRIGDKEEWRLLVSVEGNPGFWNAWGMHGYDAVKEKDIVHWLNNKSDIHE